MSKNKFAHSASTMPAPINTIPEIYSDVNINHNNGFYHDLQISRSVNGKPVTQNELINSYMISEGGAMKIILTARKRAMEESQFDESKKLKN